MSCDVGKLTEGRVGEPFRHFSYVTTHSPTHPSLYLRHSSFFNPFVASPTSQFILQPSFRFSYVTSSSLNRETTVWTCACSLCMSPTLQMVVLIRNNSVTSFCEECVYWRVLGFQLTPPHIFSARTLMPGFSNVRYRFYSDIDRLTAVLALHERKIVHPFDKYLLT